MSEDTRSGGFWRTIPGILTAATATITALAGLVAALAQAGIFSSAPPAAAANTAPEVRGRWTAEVAYPWDVKLQETFVFRVEGDTVFGTASFLGVPRGIENGVIRGEKISFTTRAEQMLGSEVTAFENRYDGLIFARGIAFVLQDNRGNPPVEFTARRID